MRTVARFMLVGLVAALLLSPFCYPLAEAATRVRIHRPGPDVILRARRGVEKTVTVPAAYVRVRSSRRYADDCGG